MAPAGRAWRLAFVLLAGVSAATLLGSQWEFLDLVAPFQAHLAAAWLLALALFAGFRSARAAFRRPGRAAAAALLLLGLHLALLAQLFLPANPAAAPDSAGAPLTVVWFNMQHKAEALRALEAEFDGGAPDLLALAETNRDTAPDPRWGLIHSLHDPTAFLGIWSRWPLENLQSHPVERDRAVVDATIVIEGRRLPVIAVHWRLPIRPSQQAAAAFLAGLVRGRADCLVLGDFNATPWSSTLRLLEREGGLRRARLPLGPFNTWCADRWHLLGVPIDHVLSKGAVRVEALRLLPWNESDHRPIRALITLAGNWPL